MANVEKAMKKTRTPHTPPPRSSSSVAVSHIGRHGMESVKVKHEERETLLGAAHHQTPDALFTREASSDMSDISVEDGARLLLDFFASVRAAQGTPSP